MRMGGGKRQASHQTDETSSQPGDPRPNPKSPVEANGTNKGPSKWAAGLRQRVSVPSW